MDLGVVPLIPEVAQGLSTRPGVRQTKTRVYHSLEGGGWGGGTGGSKIICKWLGFQVLSDENCKP